jgi:hypothetical protein
MLTVPANQSSGQFYFRGNRAITAFEVRATSTLTAPPSGVAGNAILPNVPAKLVYGAPTAQSAQAGTCTASPYVVNVLDLYDNPTSFAAAQTMTVTSNPGGVTVGPAGSCSTASSVNLPAGAQSATFTARHTVTTPGLPYTLTASAGGFSTAPPATFTVTPGNPQLDVDNPLGATTSLMAGQCQTVTLTRRDQFGNNAPTSGNNNIVINFPPTTNWDVFTSMACTTGLGGTPTMNSTHTTTFSIRPRSAGAHMVAVSVAGTSNTIAFNVAPGAPTLVFEVPNTGLPSAAASQSAGGCTQVTVARKDPYGNDVPLGGAGGSVTFNLPAGTTAHSDSMCMTGISSIPLTATDARATFYVRATVSLPTGGNAVQTVGAVLGGQTANLTLTVSPGTPTLRLVAPSGGMASVTADLACVTVTVERRDAFNNLVPIPGGTTSLTLTAPVAALLAYDSNNCTGTALAQTGMAPNINTSVPVTVGASAKTFSVRSTRAASLMLTVTLATQTVNFTVTISPGPLATLLIEAVPNPFTAGACSSAIVVRRRDGFSNDIINDPPLSVMMSAPLFTFSSTATTCAGAMSTAVVNIPTGSAVSTDPLYVTATMATQPATTSITATSMAPAATGMATTVVQAGAPTQLVFLNGAGSAVSGICSGQLQVELRDAYNNQVRPSAAQTVTLSSSAGATFSTGGTCMGALPLQLTSASPVGAFSFRPTTATTHTITANAMALGLMNSQAWTVTPGTPAKLVWRQAPVTNPNRFACVSAGILETRDAADNLTTVPANLTVTPTSSAGSVTFFADSACTTPATTLTIATNNDATAEFYMLATGDNTQLSATATGVTAAPNQNITVGGGMGALVVTPANPDLEAGGCIALQVERRDDTNAVLT